LLFLFEQVVPGLRAATVPDAAWTETRGTLEVLSADDFDHQRMAVLHYLREGSTGRRFKLHLPPGAPAGLESGAAVRVRGLVHDDEIEVAPLGGATSGLVTYGTMQPLVSGSQQTIIIMVNFTNEAISCSVAAVSNTVFSLKQLSVNQLYQQTSFGNMLWAGVAVGPYTINYGMASCDPAGWAAAADAAAVAAGVDLSAYGHKVYALPGPGLCGWGGLATVGGYPSQAWVSSCNNIFQFAHEMGHGLGLNHSSTDPNNDGVIDAEYGDSSDFMSACYCLTRLNGPHMLQMNWTPPEKIQALASSGTYQVSPLELAGPAPQTQIFTIPIPGSAESYYLSYRQGVGFDTNLSSAYESGVCLHRWCCGNSSRLITTLTDGASFTDANVGFTLNQVSHDPMGATFNLNFLAAVPPQAPAFVAATATAGGTLRLSATGLVGRAYWLLAGTNLFAPNTWSHIATNTADANGAFTFSSLSASPFQRQFYRLQLAP
jgi:hypothetical protein